MSSEYEHSCLYSITDWKKFNFCSSTLTWPFNEYFVSFFLSLANSYLQKTISENFTEMSRGVLLSDGLGSLSRENISVESLLCRSISVKLVILPHHLLHDCNILKTCIDIYSNSVNLFVC